MISIDGSVWSSVGKIQDHMHEKTVFYHWYNPSLFSNIFVLQYVKFRITFASKGPLYNHCDFSSILYYFNLVSTTLRKIKLRIKITTDIIINGIIFTTVSKNWINKVQTLIFHYLWYHHIVHSPSPSTLLKTIEI